MSKISIKEFKKTAIEYVEKSKKAKEFDLFKKTSNLAFKEFFDSNNIVSSYSFNLKNKQELINGPVSKITVTKCQRSNFDFDIPKLKKVLKDKKVISQVIDKEYTITNMQGLIEYLKPLGVNPKKLKSFLSIKETVNVPQLEQLYSLGMVDKEEVAKCGKVSTGPVYFQVKEKLTNGEIS